MASTSNESLNGILNEITNTVHRQEVGGAEYQTECGITHSLIHDK